MADPQNPQQGPGQGQPGGIMDSIVMAFNLGVSAHQQTRGGASVVEIVNELGEAIYSNLSRMYGGQYQDDFLRANTEYFLQIALLGYIIPGICAFDENFKDRLLALIEAKVRQSQQKQGSGTQGGNIVVP